MPASIFEKYWNTVSDLLGGKPSKRMAITLSENPPVNFDSVLSVRKLYESLACDGWKIAAGRNWEWRIEAPAYSTSSPEVTLEREVIAGDTTNQWTCQMSTASGIQGPYLNKRRAIDLVRRTAPDCYAFVELKVDSDNPLYAAFEILGYALAYLHARRHDCNGVGIYDVMTAQEIDLVVLGSNEWYEYKKRGAHAQKKKFKLDWLSESLEQGLNSITEGIPRVRITFDGFINFGEPKLTAAGIVLDAIEW